MTVTYHSGRRIQGLSTEFNNGAGLAQQFGAWKELGRRTVGSGEGDIDNLTVSNLDGGSGNHKDYFMILFHGFDSGQCNANLQFNSDNGSSNNNKYSSRTYRHGGNSTGGTQSTYTTADFIIMNLNSTYDDKFHVAYVDNTAGKEHLTISFGTEQGIGSGSANAPSWIAVNGKYASTDRITSVTIHNTASGYYAEGSEVVVLGWDPTDTHTTGFWQELDSVNHTSGDTRKISTTNTVDKRYMWVQGYIKQDSTYALGMVVNDDGSASSPSNNYAFSFRGNYNLTTSTNENTWTLDPTWSTLAGGGAFVNTFLANKENKNKLALNQHAENPATGSGAGAEPHSMWSTGKWGGNALITKINYITEGTSQGQLKDGSKFKVWGSD